MVEMERRKKGLPNRNPVTASAPKNSHLPRDFPVLVETARRKRPLPSTPPIEATPPLNSHARRDAPILVPFERRKKPLPLQPPIEARRPLNSHARRDAPVLVDATLLVNFRNGYRKTARRMAKWEGDLRLGRKIENAHPSHKYVFHRIPGGHSNHGHVPNPMFDFLRRGISKKDQPVYLKRRVPKFTYDAKEASIWEQPRK